jgi:glycosyltransferase involved in cell wall biosynthesis
MIEQIDRETQIFGLCLVKNEADIIAQSLEAAIEWCDYIFVYDNGSDDGTWEIVSELATRSHRIVPFKRDDKPFQDSLRHEIFEHYREKARDGDWWCRCDADEFYIDDPRKFLDRVPTDCDVVWSASFQFYFTDQDAALYRINPHAFDDSKPIQEKCRYYRNDWSEPRFFRHHPAVRYETHDWPIGLGQSYPRRIRLKHFQSRSPAQILKRFATRKEAMLVGMFRHESVPNWSARILTAKPTAGAAKAGYLPESWEERIVDAGVLLYDDGDAEFIINEALLPPIRNLR